MLKQLCFSGPGLLIMLLLITGPAACTAEDSATPSTPETGTTSAENETLCPATRPEICTREYRPVCGRLEDGSRKTYGNGCESCADARVVAFSDGACE